MFSLACVAYLGPSLVPYFEIPAEFFRIRVSGAWFCVLLSDKCDGLKAGTRRIWVTFQQDQGEVCLLQHAKNSWNAAYLISMVIAANSVFDLSCLFDLS